MSFISSCISIKPLASLVAFMIIPAHKQHIFMAGVGVVTTVFLNTVFRVIAGWAVKTDFIQNSMHNITNSETMGTVQAVKQGNTGRYQGHYNEL